MDLSLGCLFTDRLCLHIGFSLDTDDDTVGVGVVEKVGGESNECSGCDCVGWDCWMHCYLDDSAF